eukprot:gene52210-49260_t
MDGAMCGHGRSGRPALQLAAARYAATSGATLLLRDMLAHLLRHRPVDPICSLLSLLGARAMPDARVTCMLDAHPAASAARRRDAARRQLHRLAAWL